MEWSKVVHFLAIGLFFGSSTNGIETHYLVNLCGQQFDMEGRGLSEVLLELSSTGNYMDDMDCQVNITAAREFNLLFNVMDVSLRDCNDGIQFFGESTDQALTANKLCSDTSDYFRTSASNGIVKFTSDSTNNEGNLRVLVTTYHSLFLGKCVKGFFKCDTDICVRSELKCNKRNNCGDNSDEKKKNGERCDDGDDYPWYIPVGCAFGGFIFVCFFCHLKKKHNIKKLQEAQKTANEAKAKQAAQKKKADAGKKTDATKKTDGATADASKKSDVTKTGSTKKPDVEEAATSKSTSDQITQTTTDRDTQTSPDITEQGGGPYSMGRGGNSIYPGSEVMMNVSSLESARQGVPRVAWAEGNTGVYMFPMGAPPSYDNVLYQQANSPANIGTTIGPQFNPFQVQQANSPANFGTTIGPQFNPFQVQQAWSNGGGNVLHEEKKQPPKD